MSCQLLTTKLYIPRPQPNLVLRPRMTQRLNAGLGQKLTLICTPAGFGKTTLLAEWIPTSERCVSWVSLDESDNDPIQFWTYFIAALQMLQNNLCENALAMLQTQSLQPPLSQSFLASLVNEIAAFSDNFALVLDDYHLITAQPIHKALTFLLDHLPPQMHLIIAGRSVSSLSLSRLRIQRELNELRADDLRFTPDEVTAYFNIMNLRLSTDDITILETRARGWAVGLQVAALSLQGRGTAYISSFIQNFNGIHRYIADYITEEVLQRHPERTQTFLLYTSILDRLTGPLCDTLTDQSDSQTILEKLEQANLFIFPQDEERCWYRYHPLFVDLLRHRLRSTQSEMIPQLHLRASQWYEENELIKEALNHALAVGDSERIARLMAKNVPASKPQSKYPNQSTNLVTSRPLLQPLTKRELDVLRLLKTDLSGPEIARELMVALSTIRFHTQNIYSKLNVHNRRAAVQKADELNLL